MMLTALVSVLFLAASSCVYAHTTVQAAWIDDVDQGLSCGVGGFGTPVFERCPGTNNPVKDLTSDDMTCNIKNVEAPVYLQVQAGDKFTFEWHHNTRTTTDDIIASSHKGPVQVYIAPLSASAPTDSGWIKLWADAGNTSYWGVDKLIAAKGKHYITIPDLVAGKYLLRPEILALHEADVSYVDNPLRGVQVYTECLQIEIVNSTSSSVELPAGVAIPGAYNYSDPGIVYDLYRKAGLLPYVIPGPDVWSGYTGDSGFEYS